MKEFKLIKKERGKKFLYIIIDKEGNKYNDRITTNNYIACTIDGEIYFSTLENINIYKAKHKKEIIYL